MQEENKISNSDKNDSTTSAQPELSGVWQELLGKRPIDSDKQFILNDGAIPTLTSDPWSELSHTDGTEIVDLQKVHLQVSDQDVEHILEVMRERPDQQPVDKPSDTP